MGVLGRFSKTFERSGDREMTALSVGATGAGPAVGAGVTAAADRYESRSGEARMASMAAPSYVNAGAGAMNEL